MAGETPNGNGNGGYVRWDALDRHKEAEYNARHALDERCQSRIRELELRVNNLESVIDQQRGARALIYVLIGSNFLAAFGLIIAMVR